MNEQTMNNHPIPDLLTSYLEPGEPQQKIVDDINDAMGWDYISRQSISHWINGVHPPTAKTALTIMQSAPRGGKLWQLFNSILKVLEENQTAKIIAD